LFATVIGGVASANLTPASGRQDHTTSPSASAPFVKSASASTASRPAFRDDRKPPLCGTGRAELVEMICPTGKAEYFCKGGWTGNPPDSPSGKSVDVYDQVVTRLRCFPRLPLCRAVIE
jgi:hypothetical protein